MIFKNTYTIGIEDIGKSNFATNKAILSIMEDVACKHGADLKYGVNNLSKTKQAWILLNWKMKVLERPVYNDNVCAYTWSRKFEKAYACRDFKLKGDDGRVYAIGTSRWLLFDIETRRPVRLNKEIEDLYGTEKGIDVFEDEIYDIRPDLEVIKKSQKSIYKVQRRDIDINGHVHNTNYLEIAYEMLPWEIYESKSFENIEITYKKEIRYGDEVTCCYYTHNDNHFVAMMVEDRVNAVVSFK